MKPRSNNLTYEDVASAIESILAGGSRPTSRRILLQLGRGSLTTISDFAREYFSSPRYSLHLSKGQLSDQFLGAAIAEVKRISDAMTQKNSLQLAIALEDLDDANRELADALSESANQTSQNKSLEEKINRLESAREMEQAKADMHLDAEKNRAKALELELRSTREELTQAKNSIAISEHQVNGVNDLKKRLELVEDANSELQKDIKQLNHDLREALNDKASLEKELLMARKRTSKQS